jgi:hypothetical protein
LQLLELALTLPPRPDVNEHSQNCELPFLSLFLLLSVYEVEMIPFLVDGRVRVELILTERRENMYLFFVSAGFDGNFVTRFYKNVTIHFYI